MVMNPMNSITTPASSLHWWHEGRIHYTRTPNVPMMTEGVNVDVDDCDAIALRPPHPP
jgi:hypothetical protein